jgi:hypothetical protein
MSTYSYNRTAAKKKPTADKPEEPAKKKPSSRTDGAKPGEIEVAIRLVERSIDAVHDCAPNGKDYREDGDFDSKSYQKEVEAHSDRIHALNNIKEELTTLLEESKGRKQKKKTASYDRTPLVTRIDAAMQRAQVLAASTTMRAGMWYEQKSVGLWFLAQKEQKNGGFAGKMVRWTTRNPKAINDSVPKSFWSLWKELPDSEVPQEVKDAV